MADQSREGLLSPFLRVMRVRAARPYLLGRVLDFGCGSGALAGTYPAEKYVGYDHDETVIQQARRAFPQHQFTSELPQQETFDTIAALAVIEHVAEPATLLHRLSVMLTAEGHIVLTTPVPKVAGLHACGAMIGLFSSHASDEHQELLDSSRMRSLADVEGLKLTEMRRFLLCSNQLFVLAK